MMENLVMTEAFFVGKNEILAWIKATFSIDLKKIENACTGSIYCMIIDAIHPNKVKMHKVNWRAKLEHAYLMNYKISQQAFIDCQIQKNIQVEKLAKGKYQDNLELLQWMKGYFDMKNPMLMDYDPIRRRNGAILEIANDKQTKNKSGNIKGNKESQNKRTPSPVMRSDKFFNKLVGEKNQDTIVTMKLESTSRNILKSLCANTTEPQIENNQISEVETVLKSEVENIKEEIKTKYQERVDIAQIDIAKLKTETNTLKISISEIAKEKEFYYSKLRDIEFLVAKDKNLEKNDLVKIIKDILYSEKDLELVLDQSGNVSIKS